MKRWSIHYHEGRELQYRLERWHASPHSAITWCERRSIPIETIRITEWDDETSETIIGTMDLAHFQKEANRYAVNIEMLA